MRRWRWWRNTTLRISTKNERAPWFLTCKKPSKSFSWWDGTNANVRLYHRINSRKELIELFEQIPRFRTKEMTKNQVIWDLRVSVAVYIFMLLYVVYIYLICICTVSWCQICICIIVFAQCCHVFVNKVEATLDAEKEASRVWRKETEVFWIGIGIVKILDHKWDEVYNISGFNLYANYL